MTVRNKKIKDISDIVLLARDLERENNYDNNSLVFYITWKCRANASFVLI